MSAKSSGRWEGIEDDEWWRLEIEPDKFSETTPHVVSVTTPDWSPPPIDGLVWGGLAALSPEQAREAAAVLLAAADRVEKLNAK